MVIRTAELASHDVNVCHTGDSMTVVLTQVGIGMAAGITMPVEGVAGQIQYSDVKFLRAAFAM